MFLIIILEVIMWATPKHNIEDWIKYYFMRYRGKPKTVHVNELKESFAYDFADNPDFSKSELETQLMNTLHQLAKSEEEKLIIQDAKVTGDYFWPEERLNWKPTSIKEKESFDE